MRGVSKLGAGTAIGWGMKFVLQMFLTRLLVPEEFMVWGIILAIIAVCEAVAEVGVRQSIVQNDKGNTPEFMNMAWWFQAFRGVGLYLTAFLLSPLICRFYFSSKPEILHLYTEAELLMLLRIAFISILCNGFISPGIHVLRKEFRFGRLVIYLQGSSFVNIVVTLYIAYFVFNNAWAIVLGYLAENIFRCCLSFFVYPFRPRFKIDRESLREILKFVRGIIGMPVLTILVTQIDDFFLGRMIAPTFYGYYTRAKYLSRMPQQLFAQVVNPVLLPAFTEKKKDLQGTRKGLLIMTSVTSTLYLPILVFLGLHAKSILSIVWGADYGIMSRPFVWLFCFVIIRTQSLYFVSMIMAMGKPHIVRAFLFLRLLLAAGMIYPAIKHYEASGAVSVLVLSNLIALLFQVVAVKSYIELSLSIYLRMWVPGLLVSCPVLLIGMPFKHLLVDFKIGSILTNGFIAVLGCTLGLWWIKKKTAWISSDSN